MGYEIARVVPAREFNRFSDPKWRGKTEPDAEDLVMVYVDNDILDVLTQWKGAEEAKRNMQIQQQLHDARRSVIEDWWENATKKDLHMGRGETVDDVEGWEHNGFNEYTRTYYVGHTCKAGPTRAMRLTLAFHNMSPQLRTVHVDGR